MGRHAQGGGVGGGVADATQARAARSYVWGPLSALGLALAAITCAIDQATKLWLLDVFDLAGRARVTITSFLDLVLTWNTGISYGLFPQEGSFGQWALLAFKAAAVVFLWIWLARAPSRLTAAGLGLIVGGAFGNAIDRLHWPGVMDFVLFHIETAAWSFRWYVFNFADVAIVAGVVGLLYDSLRAGRAAKAP
jgi:signal peptidase II